MKAVPRSVPASKGADLLHCVGAMTSSKMCSIVVEARSYLKSVVFGSDNACATDGIHQPTLSVANNAPAHAELDDLVAEYDDVPLFCLAPYSQLLNPLELVWSSFKSRIKRNPRERMEELAAWSC